MRSTHDDQHPRLRPADVPRYRTQPARRQVSDAIRRHLAGDRSAMTDLTRIVRPWLHHVIRGHRLPAHTVEDAVQSTLLAVLRHVDDLRNPDAGLAWISVVARREALREVRAQQRYVLVDEPDVVMPAAPDPAEIALDRISHAVVRRTVQRAPAAAPPAARADHPGRPAELRLDLDGAEDADRQHRPDPQAGLERMRQLLTDDPAWEWDVPA